MGSVTVINRALGWLSLIAPARVALRFADMTAFLLWITEASQDYNELRFKLDSF